MYAQQVVSAIAVVLLIILIVYLNTVVKKLKENRDLLSDRSSLVKAQQNCIDLNTVFSYW